MGQEGPINLLFGLKLTQCRNQKQTFLTFLTWFCSENSVLGGKRANLESIPVFHQMQQYLGRVAVTCRMSQ